MQLHIVHGLSFINEAEQAFFAGCKQLWHTQPLFFYSAKAWQGNFVSIPEFTGAGNNWVTGISKDRTAVATQVQQRYQSGDTIITTEYGEVYKVFGFPSAHTGLDIAPKAYEGVGRAVLAADNGIAYNASASCGYNIAGGSSMGKGVIVDHQNGVVTLYWHIL